MVENEAGKMMALMLVLMNLLILTTVGGLVWIVQIVFSQASGLNALIYAV